MGLREVYKADGGSSRKPALVAGAVLSVVFIALLFVWSADGPSKGTASSRGGRTPAAGQATTPSTVPISDQESDARLGHNHGAEAQALGGDAHTEQLPNDYKDTPIPPSQFLVMFPHSQSGLSDDVRVRASTMATELVTAQVTGVGREKFPNYFPSRSDPALPYATNFVVEFSTAMAVPGDPSLIRTVTLWKGLGSGNVPFLQVRIANYLKQGSGGSLRPMVTGELPTEIQRSDSWLSGISILG